MNDAEIDYSQGVPSPALDGLGGPLKPFPPVPLPLVIGSLVASGMWVALSVGRGDPLGNVIRDLAIAYGIAIVVSLITNELIG